MLNTMTVKLETSPSPFPSEFDTSLVTPGVGGAVLFTVLVVSLVVLVFSMNRHIKKVNFAQNDSKL